MRCKLTRSFKITVPSHVTSTWDSTLQPDGFFEFKRLIKNFESCVFRRLVCRVIPQQNVSNNSTSTVATYCMFPWHRQGVVEQNYDKYLSMDRVKVYKQTQVGRMSWVPNTLILGNGGQVQAEYCQIVWKPRIARIADEHKYYPYMYGGIVAFEPCTLPSPAPNPLPEQYFTIILTAYVTFYGQNNFGVD